MSENCSSGFGSLESGCTLLFKPITEKNPIKSNNHRLLTKNFPLLHIDTAEERIETAEIALIFCWCVWRHICSATCLWFKIVSSKTAKPPIKKSGCDTGLFAFPGILFFNGPLLTVGPPLFPYFSVLPTLAGVRFSMM